MPRTPLLRALVRLAADALRGRPSRRDPAGCAGRTPELTRREFLVAGAAAGAALSTLGALRPSAARAASSPRIAIVGGGIAGLTPASTGGQGSRLDGLRGIGPVGGRMHSDTDHVGLRPDERVVRRADRQRAQDDPLARATVPAPDRRTFWPAEPNGSEDTYYSSAAYYTAGAGRRATSRPCTRRCSATSRPRPTRRRTTSTPARASRSTT